MSFWQSKVVVLTGGSGGFGFELAQMFAGKEATVVIVARDEKRLSTAVELAAAEDLQLHSQIVDVTDDDSVNRAVSEIVARHGRIDVWVNNVGKSTRTSVMDCGLDQYRDLMEINFYSAIRCALAVQEHLENSSGHLVNIGSLASKTGWPFVAPYATSKHALAAFNHQLRLEGPRNVHYLLVCPGPIQRADAGKRYESEAKRLDPAASQPGGGAKLKGISPAKLAEKIENSLRKRRPELVVPGYAKILFSVAQLFPSFGDFVLRKSRKKK